MAGRRLPGPRTAARRRLIAELLAERAESGESYRALEERSGIPAPTLAWWQSKLRREAAESDAIEWVEVDCVNADVPASPWLEVVLPSSVVIRIPVDCAAEVLGRVLDKVAARC